MSSNGVGVLKAGDPRSDHTTSAITEDQIEAFHCMFINICFDLQSGNEQSDLFIS